MAGGHATSTIKRRRIGALLRTFREEQRILSKDAAKEIGMESTRLGLIERGRYRVTAEQITGLLEVYGVTDETIRDELCRAAEEPVTTGWWYQYREILTPSYYDLIALEHEAEQIRSWSTDGMMGLLQDPAYAREVQQSTVFPDLKPLADDLVAVRMARHQVMNRTNKPVELHAILAEHLLYAGRNDAPRMVHSQLSHLLKVSNWSNVTIQIMPMHAPVGVMVVPSFAALYFADPWPDVVTSSGPSGGVVSDSPRSQQWANDVFPALTNNALSADDSREFLKEKLREVSDADT